MRSGDGNKEEKEYQIKRREGVWGTGKKRGDWTRQNGKALERKSCLLYTSDAADETQRVDLGGRRIIKKIFF